MISLKSFSLLNSFNINFIQSLKYSTNFVKNIGFKTCGQLYEELRTKNQRLYRNSPSDGLDVNVEYVDTFDDNDSKSDVKVKTIVAIHGNPGHHKHFSGLIDYFGAKDSKVRVIVPNLPDFGLTRKTMAFWHSNEERTQLIHDFLKAINVSTIDCLISHSAAIHPISSLWTDPKELTIRSIAIYCPQYAPQKFFDLNKSLSIFTKSRFGIKVIDVIRPELLAKLIPVPFTYNNGDEVLYNTLVHSWLKMDQLVHKLNVLRQKQIPTLVVYGESDRLIPKYLYEEMVQTLGPSVKDSAIYSSDLKCEKPIESVNNWLKVLIFRSGGHFAYAKYSEIVNKYLEKQLKDLK